MAELTTPRWLKYDEMFRAMAEHPIRQNWVENADVAYQFEQGDQWTNQEKAALKERNQPAIVHNEVRPAKERLLGKFRRFRTTIRLAGRNTPDQKLGEAGSDLLRQVDYVNGYEFVEAEVGNDQLIGGLGVLEVKLETDEQGDYAIKYYREDPFAIFLDPFSRSYDWNDDARFMARAKWMYLDEAIKMWPESKAELRRLGSGTSGFGDGAGWWNDPSVLKNRNWLNIYYDDKLKRVRPIELYWKERERGFRFITPEGAQTVFGITQTSAQTLASRLGIEFEEIYEDRIYCVVYVAGVILWKERVKPDQVNKYPWIPYWAFRKADGEPQGYIWGLMDPQREINARRSKALWSINNRQWKHERSAIRNKAEFANEAARADGMLEVEDGKMDKVEMIVNTDISQGNIALLQDAKQAIRRTVGEDQVNPAPEMRSGVGLQKIMQTQQDAVLSLFDNLRRSRRLKAKLTYELIARWYDDDMAFEITDDPNVRRIVNLRGEDFKALRELRYDLVAEDVQDYATAQQEQFTELLTALPQVIQFGPAWAGLLIQMSELRNKDGLLKIIEGMSQPSPLEPKVSLALQWDNLPPAEKIAWSQRLGMAELAQAVQQMPTPPVFLAQNEAEVAKVQMKTQGDLQGKLIDAKKDLMVANVEAATDEHKIRSDAAVKSEQAKAKASEKKKEGKKKNG